jgi:tRNA pseudouridine38/39 synthase
MMDLEEGATNEQPIETFEKPQTGTESATANTSSQPNHKKRGSGEMMKEGSTVPIKSKGPIPNFKARFDLEKLNQRQLVDLVLAHQASANPALAASVESKKNRFNLNRDIDWDKYSVRHIAFKVAYLGWDFLGLAAQPDTTNTIEGSLSDAFRKVKLIKSYDSCHWTRAGRTDKGVSALGQVIACHVRSNVKSGVGMVKVGNDTKDDAEELDYVTMLNGALPDEIRVLGWTPVPLEFNARFSAISRTYKYFFAKENMNIPAMREAMGYLIGEHDFRNFCKMDTANVSHFGRCVLSASVSPVATYPTFDPSVYHPLGDEKADGAQNWNAMYEFTISGSAFLWHQVRYMVAALFMVGRGQEPPSMIRNLLDISKYPQKPHFHMASEVPLVLYDVGYFGLQFYIDSNAQRKLVQHFTDYWAERSIKAHMVQLYLTHLDHSQVTLQYSDEASPSSLHQSKKLSKSDAEPAPSSHPTSGQQSNAAPLTQMDTDDGHQPLPMLLSPHDIQVMSGNRPAKKDIKNLFWTSPTPRPETVQWGFVKDQVMHVYHPRYFHMPLEERQLEGTEQFFQLSFHIFHSSHQLTLSYDPLNC